MGGNKATVDTMSETVQHIYRLKLYKQLAGRESQIAIAVLLMVKRMIEESYG